jgi:hypothetical protein
MSSIRMRVVVVALWLVSLVAAGTFAQSQVRPLQTRPAAPLTNSTVFSGPDIGFQATETGGKTVIGKLVVRVNGQWKDAEFAQGPRIQPLSMK